MSAPLTVGIWPRPEKNYIGAFAETLKLVGISTVGLRRPWNAIGRAIDVLHIHWGPQEIFWSAKNRLDFIVRAAIVLATLSFLRLSGVKLVWSVHDLEPHDANPDLLRLWRIYATLFSFLVNGFVTLSPSTIKAARNSFSGLAKKPAIFMWHDKFEIQAKSDLGFAWRRRHGIDDTNTVFGLIGTLGRYKGATELATVFTATYDPRYRLVIAGRAKDVDMRRSLSDIAARDKRILLDLRWLSDDELLETTMALDAIVLPYTRTLHSASIVHGLSCGKPVITPTSPFAADIQFRIGSDWIRTYELPLSTDVIATFRKRTENNTPNLDFMSMGESGLKLKHFYLTLKRRTTLCNLKRP